MSFSDTARETTSPEIASLASKGLDDPSSLTPDQIKSVCASALSQAPDRSYGPDDESHGARERALGLAQEMALEGIPENYANYEPWQVWKLFAGEFARRLEVKP